MSTVRSLNIVLGANTQEFVVKMDAAAKKAKKTGDEIKGGLSGFLASNGISASTITAFSTSVSAVGEVLRGVTKAAGVAAHAIEEVATAIGHWVSEGFEAINQAHDLAHSLGVTTESLQGLQAAFALDGVQVDQVSQMLMRMQKAIGDIAILGTTGPNVFDTLGISAKRLAQLSPDQQIYAVAEGLRNLQTQTERATVATTLFGRSGVMAIPTLIQGANALKDLAQRAKDYGYAVSQIDSEKIDAAGDAIDLLRQHWQGIKNTLAISLAPAVEGIATEINKMIPPADELKNDFQKWMYYAAATLDSIRNTAKILYDLGTNNPIATFRDIQNPSTSAVDWLDQIENKADEAARHIKNKLGHDLGDAIAETIQRVRQMLDSLDTEAATAGMDRLGKTLYELGKAGATASDMMQAAQDIGRIEAVNESLQRQADFVKQQADLWKQIQDTVKQIADDNKNFASPIEKFREAMEDIKSRQELFGLLPDAAARMKAAAFKTLESSLNVGSHRNSFNPEVVRFHDLPAVQKSSDVQKDILNAIKAEAANVKRSADSSDLIYRQLHDNATAIYNGD